MTTLRAAAVLLIALGLQAALGRLWPAANRFVDLLILPVVWCGIVRGQRAAMLMGCAAGLLQDSWFQAGVFGMNGFKKTLLGWAVGGLGGRIDLNGQAERMFAAVLFVLADAALDLALRRVLDLDSALPSALDLVIKAVVTALLVTWSFAATTRLGGGSMNRAMQRSS